MSNCLSTVNIMFHDSVLVDSNSREKVEGVFVARFDPIEDKTDNDLLPCWTSLVPEFGFLQVHNVSNVLHDAVQGSGRENFILIVVGNRNEHLGMAIIHGRAEVVSMLQSKFVGVAGRRRICPRLHFPLFQVIT